jgi:hypothetical protein
MLTDSLPRNENGHRLGRAAPRTIVTMPAGIRDALCDTAGKAVHAFVLAQIKVLQADAAKRGETPMFDNTRLALGERPWQTFEAYIADRPKKAAPAPAAPVTVMTDAKLGLACLLVAIADLINAHGKLPAADPVGALVASAAPEAAVVRLMVAAAERMRSHLGTTPLDRDLGYPAAFRQKLEALVSTKDYIDPGAEALTRLYVDFLKVVAWHVAVDAYEHEHLTLNRNAFCAVLARLDAVVCGAGGACARRVLGGVRAQFMAWDKAVAQEKAANGPAKPRARPTSRAPRPAAKGARGRAFTSADASPAGGRPAATEAQSHRAEPHQQGRPDAEAQAASVAAIVALPAELTAPAAADPGPGDAEVRAELKEPSIVRSTEPPGRQSELSLPASTAAIGTPPLTESAVTAAAEPEEPSITRSPEPSGRPRPPAGTGQTDKTDIKRTRSTNPGAGVDYDSLFAILMSNAGAK